MSSNGRRWPAAADDETGCTGRRRPRVREGGERLVDLEVAVRAVPGFFAIDDDGAAQLLERCRDLRFWERELNVDLDA